MQKFTDKKFVEAVQILQATEAKKVGGGKRRAPRQPIRVPVQIKFEVENPDTPWTTVHLRDISPRGVLLAINQRMDVGSSLLLRLPAKAFEEQGSPLICRVCYCRQEADDLFLTGVEFVGRLDVDATPTSSVSAAQRERIQRSILD